MKIISKKSHKERINNWKNSINRYIRNYIKNGSIGDLNLYATPILELPNNLIVNGKLNLTNSSIHKLPEGLYVSDKLLIQKTFITELPNNFYDGSDVYTHRSYYANLNDPDNNKIFIKHKSVKGFVYLNSIYCL